jgi:hypothetical protein
VGQLGRERTGSDCRCSGGRLAALQTKKNGGFRVPRRPAAAFAVPSFRDTPLKHLMYEVFHKENKENERLSSL